MAKGNSLRVLVITSRPLVTQEGEPTVLLDVDIERQRIKDGLRKARIAAHVLFLPDATAGEVRSALRNDWDIVHFTGHGTEDGRLILEDGLGVEHVLTKEETVGAL
jgi:hypothetical protein